MGLPQRTRCRINLEDEFQMTPFNQPQPIRERLAQAPQSPEARQLLENFEKTGEFCPSDLQKVLGRIRGIEVTPDGIPAWAKVKDESHDKS